MSWHPQATTLLALVLIAGVGCILLASVLERILTWLVEPHDDGEPGPER